MKRLAEAKTRLRGSLRAGHHQRLVLAMAEDFTPTSWQDLQSWIKVMADTPDESIKFISVMLHHQGVKVE